MDQLIVVLITLFGAAAMIGVFMTKKPGFGPYTIRAYGIILVAVFASLLAMRDCNSLTAAMGILGSIAGYLFGLRDRKERESEKERDEKRPGGNTK